MTATAGRIFSCSALKQSSPQGIAELYRWQAGQMEREKEAYLTAGASLVKRILTGNLMKDIPGRLCVERI